MKTVCCVCVCVCGPPSCSLSHIFSFPYIAVVGFLVMIPIVLLVRVAVKQDEEEEESNAKKHVFCCAKKSKVNDAKEAEPPPLTGCRALISNTVKYLKEDVFEVTGKHYLYKRNLVAAASLAWQMFYLVDAAPNAEADSIAVLAVIIALTCLLKVLVTCFLLSPKVPRPRVLRLMITVDAICGQIFILVRRKMNTETEKKQGRRREEKRHVGVNIGTVLPYRLGSNER